MDPCSLSDLTQVTGTTETKNWFFKVLLSPFFEAETIVSVVNDLSIIFISISSLRADSDLDDTPAKPYGAISCFVVVIFFLHFKTSPHLLQLFRKMLRGCFSLWSCRIVANHGNSFSPGSSSAWGWIDDDRAFICGWTVPLTFLFSHQNILWNLPLQLRVKHNTSAQQQNIL